MSEPGSPTATPRVGVYALVGQDDCLLLVEYPEYDALPGGAVQAGEPVEQALRRMLLDQPRSPAVAADAEKGLGAHGAYPSSATRGHLVDAHPGP